MTRLARCLLAFLLSTGTLATASAAGEKATDTTPAKSSGKGKAKPAAVGAEDDEPAPAKKKTSPVKKPGAAKSSTKVKSKDEDEDLPAKKPKAENTAKKPAATTKTGTAHRPSDSSDESNKSKGKTTTNGVAKKSSSKPAHKSAPDADDGDEKPATAAKTSTPAKSKSPVKSPQTSAAKTPVDNAGDSADRPRSTSANATISTDEIRDFSGNSAAVQNLLRLGLALTERDLTYTYGSADPATGGMDCSGTVYYLLRAAGLKDVPRDSSGLYLWAQEAGTLHVVNASSLDDPQFAGLRPGDLLFWEGTYVVRRDPPISHTMIYLGREKQTGAPIMVGASDGRSYHGLRRNGVSVFDFKLPKPESPARFVAYARVPGL